MCWKEHYLGSCNGSPTSPWSGCPTGAACNRRAVRNSRISTPNHRLGNNAPTSPASYPPTDAASTPRSRVSRPAGGAGRARRSWDRTTNGTNRRGAASRRSRRWPRAAVFVLVDVHVREAVALPPAIFFLARQPAVQHTRHDAERRRLDADQLAADPLLRQPEALGEARRVNPGVLVGEEGLALEGLHLLVAGNARSTARAVPVQINDSASTPANLQTPDTKMAGACQAVIFIAVFPMFPIPFLPDQSTRPITRALAAVFKSIAAYRLPHNHAI